MADEWHVRWLAEGVKKWNKRRKKVTFRPDLSGVNFFQLLPWDFRDSPKTSRYFEKIDLSNSNLSRADLSGLNFSRARFDDSDLSGARLNLSNFTKADFSRSKLSNANGDRSVFTDALFIQADIDGATFEEASAKGAILIHTQITQEQLTSLADSRLQRFQTLSEFNSLKAMKLMSAAGSVDSTPMKTVNVDDSTSYSEQIGRKGDLGHSKPKLENERVSSKRYDVFFGTNRSPIMERGAVVGFGDFPNSDLSFGVCEVVVPEGHRVGSIGSPLWKRVLRRIDDRLKIESVVSLNEQLFWEHLKQNTAKMQVKARPTVFIHGYNTSFPDAVIRAAQIGFDLGIGQGVGLFSWPSKGSKRNYVSDEAAVEASKYLLADFIEKFVENSERGGINLIAHSMGCRCVLNAIEVLSNGRKSVLRRINQVILAAADVDASLMPNLGRYSVSACGRTTSYVCGSDLALKISGWLHGFPRVGLRPPTFVLSGMDTIVVNDDDLGDFAHGYIGTSRVVLNDVHALLKTNAPPSERFSVEKVEDGSEIYWRLKD